MPDGYYKRVYKGVLSHLVRVDGQERHFYKIANVDYPPVEHDGEKAIGESYIEDNHMVLYTASFYTKITKEEYLKIKIKGGEL